MVIKSRDSTISLPLDTLMPMGAIKGRITLLEGGDPGNVFVLAFGIDRVANVQPDGERMRGGGVASTTARLILYHLLTFFIHILH